MKKTSLIALLIVLVTISCTEKIDLDLQDQDSAKLVVEALFTTEKKAHEVRLTQTANYFSNVANPAISNAIVTISDVENEFILTESDTKPGSYYTAADVFGIADRSYELKVVDSEGEEYISNVFLDSVAVIDSVTWLFEEDPYTAYTGEVGYYYLSLYAQETPGVGDNYAFKVYVKNSDGEFVLDNDTIDQSIFFDDEFIDGYYLEGVDIYYIDASKIDRDSVDIRVEMSSIPTEYIEFVYSVLFETTYSGGLFGSIPANVTSNISNDAVGFFVTSDVESYEFTIYKQH